MKRISAMMSIILYSSGVLPAAACGGWYDVACNVGKTLEKAGQDTGKTLEKAGQDTGKTLEKAGQDTGKTLEKAGQDTGKTLEKAGQDTGKTIEKAAHDTGHALEKAGQDIGHFLKQAIDFDLDCSLTGSKPADLAEPYRDQCSGHLSTYRSDIDACNNVGGASVIAAGTAGAALSATYSAGATYALAKLAFEICQGACRSQMNLNECVISVDSQAQAVAEQSEAERAANDRLEEIATCMDDAYAAETILMADSILEACEASGDCSTSSEQFSAEFVSKVKDLRKGIEVRREQAKANLLAGSAIKPDYGPFVASSALSEVTLNAPGGDVLACRLGTPQAELRIVAGAGAPSRIGIEWRREGVAATNTQHAFVDGRIKSTIDLSAFKPGIWEAAVLGPDGASLGSFGFVWRPEG